MAVLFRGIGNKAWWDKSRDDFPWLGDDELISDVLKSLATVNGTLSVYAIDDAEANIRRVVAALASRRHKIENFDYILVPANQVTGVFNSSITQGNTPDETVNEWHLDLVHLTSAKLHHLSHVFAKYKVSVRRMPKPGVKSALQFSKDNGFLDLSKVSEKVVKALD